MTAFRSFLVTHRPPVRPEELPRPTPFLAQRWASAPEFCGGLIEERDAAPGIGRVHGDAKRFEELAIAGAIDRRAVE